tara:strand:+ start:503 stop:1156 length:654 start_codon:yes stop_codon:yes gene_type:complete
MNFEIARNVMVENQLRPNRITDSIIIDILNETPKEDFLTDDLKYIAYSDEDIELINKRGYLKNLHIAQLLQYSNITKKDKILHIGGLSGYVTSILSKLSNNVIVIENNDKLLNELKKNLKINNIENVEVINCNLEFGYLKKHPYDIIFIDCPIKSISNEILNQLNPNYGKLIMIEKINEELSKGIKITNIDNKFNKEILFDIFSKFTLFKEKDEFIF